jgi:hypothetical protein
MRANAGRMRIGREDGQAKFMAAAFDLCERSRIAHTRQSKAGRNAIIPPRNPGAIEALRHGFIGGRESLPQSKAHIGRAGLPLAKDLSGKTAQARAAARTAAIDAKKKDFANHTTSSDFDAYLRLHVGESRRRACV